MWKFFLYPKWRYEKAEKYLSEMESKGFRLEKAIGSFFFLFKEAQPKNTRYVFLYHFMKDADERHFAARKYLLQNCHGTQVCGKRMLEPEIYRVTDSKADLDEVIQFRQAYLKRALLLRIFAALIFVLPTVLLGILGKLSFADFRTCILLIVAAIGTTVIVYHLIGLLFLRRNQN